MVKKEERWIDGKKLKELSDKEIDDKAQEII